MKLFETNESPLQTQLQSHIDWFNIEPLVVGYRVIFMVMVYFHTMYDKEPHSPGLGHAHFGFNPVSQR